MKKLKLILIGLGLILIPGSGILAGLYLLNKFRKKSKLETSAGFTTGAEKDCK